MAMGHIEQVGMFRLSVKRKLQLEINGTKVTTWSWHGTWAWKRRDGDIVPTWWRQGNYPEHRILIPINSLLSRLIWVWNQFFEIDLIQESIWKATNLKAKINLKTNPFPAQNQKLQTSTHLFASCISSQISLGLCQEASLFQVALPFAISLCTILCINSFSMFLEIVHLFHGALHFFKMPCHVQFQMQGSTLFKVCPFTYPWPFSTFVAASCIPSLVNRKCSRILYLGATLALSLMDETQGLTLAVRIGIFPTKSSLAKVQRTLGFKNFECKCCIVWCLMTLLNKVLPSSRA